MTRMGTAAILREALGKAVRYKEQIDRAGDDASKLPAYDAKMEALLPVVRKEIPLKAHAHRADDIFTSIRIANEFGLTSRWTTALKVTSSRSLARSAPRRLSGLLRPKEQVRETTNKTFETPGLS